MANGEGPPSTNVVEFPDRLPISARPISGRSGVSPWSRHSARRARDVSRRSFVLQVLVLQLDPAADLLPQGTNV